MYLTHVHTCILLYTYRTIQITISNITKRHNKGLQLIVEECVDMKVFQLLIKRSPLYIQLFVHTVGCTYSWLYIHLLILSVISPNNCINKTVVKLPCHSAPSFSKPCHGCTRAIYGKKSLYIRTDSGIWTIKMIVFS